MKSFRLLQFGLALILIILGLDKFPQFLVDWTQYFPYALLQTLHVPMWVPLYTSGIVEVIAGILVLVRPRIGGYLSAIIFLGIVMTLIIDKGFYNIVVIDSGLFFISLAVASETTS